MSEFHWIRPAWLLAIPLAIAVWWWLRQRGVGAASPWHRWVDPALHTVMISDGREQRAGALQWLALVAAVIGLVGLAGPSWERVSLPVQRGSDALVIALDLSRSMDATDVAPSRLTRARLKLLDVLAERKDGDTALLVFSANAFVVTPLTSDGATIASQVMALDSSLMPTRGSYPESGIRKALQLLRRAEVRSGDVLLITDGANLTTAMDAARELAAEGHRLHVMGVGTVEGGPIPESRGGFVTDTRGTIALPKLDPAGLARLARAGRGRYANMTSNTSDLNALGLTDSARKRAAEARAEEAMEVEQWRDAGPWLLLLCLPMIAWVLRRSVVLAPIVLVLIMPSETASANALTDWFRNDDQRAKAALEAGDAARAAELFRNPGWQATAAYRQGDFAASAEAWRALEGAEALYNEGTSLAQAGEIEQAKSVLREALAVDPNHEDAAHNLALLESLPEPPKDSGESGQQEGEQGDPQDESNGENSDDTSGESASDSAGEPSGNSDGEGQETERERDEQEEARDIAELMQALREALESGDESAVEEAAAELQQAQEAQETEQSLQQWLRRVPDDPGGLLRAKFRRQYQRRRTDQDGNMLWPDDRSEPW
ncbi:MAG: VWA domain-containing protein [Pseudomonadota bacterium]